MKVNATDIGTEAGVETPIRAPYSYEPEFIRLPVRGNCPYCQLSRPYLYELINRGLIKSVSLRKPGCTKGVRLIHLASVKSYLRERMQGQEAE